MGTSQLFFISILVPNLLVPLSTPLLIFILNKDQSKNTEEKLPMTLFLVTLDTY